MSIRKCSAKVSAQLLLKSFQGIADPAKPAPTLKDAYNLYAKLEGYKNWAHAKPYLGDPEFPNPPNPPTPVYGRSKALIQDWPVYVFYNEGYDDDTGNEVLYVMPLGATLENRVQTRGSLTPFADDNSIRAPELAPLSLAKNVRMAQLFEGMVVKEVYSLVPSPERYGLPHCANELGVDSWITEDLGWNYLSLDDTLVRNRGCVEVTFEDRGDDGETKYWMEVAVHPRIAAGIEAAFKRLAVNA